MGSDFNVAFADDDVIIVSDSGVSLSAFVHTDTGFIGSLNIGLPDGSSLRINNSDDVSKFVSMIQMLFTVSDSRKGDN